MFIAIHDMMNINCTLSPVRFIMYIISRYSMAIIIFDILDRLANLFVCMQLMTHVDKYQNIRTTIVTALLV